MKFMWMAMRARGINVRLAAGARPYIVVCVAQKSVFSRRVVYLQPERKAGVYMQIALNSASPRVERD